MVHMPLDPAELADEGWWTVRQAAEGLGWDQQRVLKHKAREFKDKERPPGQRPRWLVWGPDVREFARKNRSELTATAPLAIDPAVRIVSMEDTPTRPARPSVTRARPSAGRDLHAENAALRASLDILFDTLISTAEDAARTASDRHSSLVALRNVFRALDDAQTVTLPEDLEEALGVAPGGHPAGPEPDTDIPA
jgi:hypothetical protein